MLRDMALVSVGNVTEKEENQSEFDLHTLGLVLNFLMRNSKVESGVRRVERHLPVMQIPT